MALLLESIYITMRRQLVESMRLVIVQGSARRQSHH